MFWIPVEERLPELKLSISHGFMWESDKCIVGETNEGNQGGWTHMGRLYANENQKRIWWWTDRHGTVIEGVTHWMPMPPNPPAMVQDVVRLQKFYELIKKNTRIMHVQFPSQKEIYNMWMEIGREAYQNLDIFEMLLGIRK